MIFNEIELPGAYVVDIEPRADDRGFFARAWCQTEMQTHDLAVQIVQVNMSFNHRRGTLRGMHYQAAPYGETKLVRCTRGAIFDVIVDLRPESPTYLHWFSVELTAENRRALYVPENFAHGFQTLEDNTDVFYQVSQFYTPGAERGVRYDDPAFEITWPVPVTVISPKDGGWELYKPSSRDRGNT